ncbi:UNVERIFIED_CONTAM: Retrovirus-related Pol polyprotein from transposon RE1, partial [Sesamum indicum]
PCSSDANIPALSEPHIPASSSSPPSHLDPSHSSPAPLRRSTIATQRPTWLRDFICSAQNPTSLHPNTPAYILFFASLSVLQEPRSFSEAVQHKEWRDAMNIEIQTLEANHTWRLSSLPLRKRPIGCKWVFKMKLCADGSVERYKARLVAKGDYIARFSPVAKIVTEIYVLPPKGYSVEPNLVCKLQRSLYGLKQASHQWNVELTIKLTAFGFVQSAHDHCLFIKSSPSGPMALLVYIDDILLTGPSLDDIMQVKAYLHRLFTIKDIGDDTRMLQAKTASSPFPPGLKLTAAADAPLSRPDSYRRLVGRLLYLGFTRPDISDSMQQLSQFLNQPCDSHWKAVLHVLRYLKGCPSKRLYFPAQNSFVLRVFCDVDRVSCLDSRRSLTGYCIFLGNALLSWKTKKQCTVSRSTAESKYRSLASTVCELRWMSYILSDFSIALSLPINIFCDSKAAIHILANPVFHECTKHIELGCHLVRDAYKEDFIFPSYVPSSLQLADVFTNPLPLKVFLLLISQVGTGLVQSPSHLWGGYWSTTPSTITAAAAQ